MWNTSMMMYNSQPANGKHIQIPVFIPLSAHTVHLNGLQRKEMFPIDCSLQFNTAEYI